MMPLREALQSTTDSLRFASRRKHSSFCSLAKRCSQFASRFATRFCEPPVG
jgi:hypothetical protein